MRLSPTRACRRQSADGTVSRRRVRSFACIALFVVAAARSEPLRIIPPEPDNTTDVEDCIKRAKANESDFKRININNIKEVRADVLKELLNSLKENTHVEALEMANVGLTDSVGRVRARESRRRRIRSSVD